MDIRQATRAYEAWLRRRIPLLPADLRRKHQRMAESPFSFLRATFYHWAQLWPETCPDLARAPRLLGVGDLHVENFGTWRDREGRLIWGVNDFDEVAVMPYTNDLVRLAVSARLAISENHLSCNLDDACDVVLEGYQSALKEGGAPFVLAEKHGWLRELATGALRDPVAYWQKLDQLPRAAGPPLALATALRRQLPEGNLPLRICHRQAGLGSLGRRRFTLLAHWHGGRIAREAKELVSSAWNWMNPGVTDGRILDSQAIARAVRVPDPFIAFHQHWLLRRLAPDCSRIELAALPRCRDELKLLHAMGSETANIHLGTRASIGYVLKDLKQRRANWLRKSAAAMAGATTKDWKQWASQKV